MQKYLPDDLHPKIKEQLDSEMGGGGSGMAAAPPQGPPAAPAPSAKPKPAANGKKKSDADRSAAQPAQAAAVQRGAHDQQPAVVGKPASEDFWHVVQRETVLLNSTGNTDASRWGAWLCACYQLLCPSLPCHHAHKHGTGMSSFGRMQGNAGKGNAG